jgi:hypothetical protein
MPRSVIFFTSLIFGICSLASPVDAIQWFSMLPNPSASRDLAMGGSTVALFYAPHSQSFNPAGLQCFSRDPERRLTLFANPGGMWQLRNYVAHEAEDVPDLQQAVDAVRLLTTGIAVNRRILTMALLLSQPVMEENDIERFRNYENRSALGLHQNSIVMNLRLHPRVSVGGRVDRYYRYAYPEDEAFSYGVILKPRGIQVGVQYQRYPSSGPRHWHPLDHRSDASTTAGIAIDRENLKVTFQVMNLTNSDEDAFLEPSGGVEWRPVRSIALRAGGVQFSRSQRWALTTGIGLVDANWIRNRVARLLVPDDLVQFALAIIYRQRKPEIGIGSLTFGWRL